MANVRLLMGVLAAAILVTTLLFVIPAANAQAQSPSPEPSMQSSTISDQKLDAAAAALRRVASLQQNYKGLSENIRI
jgi:hypothetical protein